MTTFLSNFDYGNTFSPFYKSITSAALHKWDGHWHLKVRNTNLQEYDVCLAGYHEYQDGDNKRNYLTKYGILSICEFPSADDGMLTITQMFDSADAAIPLYEYANLNPSLPVPETIPNFKPAVLSYFYEISGNYLNVGLRLLNVGSGTAGQNAWRVIYRVIAHSGDPIPVHITSYELEDMPAAFDAEAPNWHDAVLINSSIRIPNFQNGVYDVYISIENMRDTSLSMCLYNSSDYIAQNEEGLYKLFTFEKSTNNQ